MFCSLPWQNLGIKKNTGCFCCCFANGTSMCQPNHFPSNEFNKDDFWKEGALWQLWNSERFQEIRRTMSNNDAVKCCDLQNSRCFNAIGDFAQFSECRNDAQKENLEKMKYNMRERKIIVDHYPNSIDMSLGSYCNLNCSHCCQKYENPPIGHLPVENFLGELKEFIRHASVVNIFGGEPLICPQYDTIISLAKEVNGAKLRTVTNGHFMIEKLLPNLDLFSNVQISVDAINSEQYAKVRHSADPHYNWDRLMFNINKISKRPRTFALDFFFVINGYNYKNIPEMIEMACQHKCQLVLLTEVFNYDYRNIDMEQKEMYAFTHNHPEELTYYVEQGKKKARELNMWMLYSFGSINDHGVIEKN